MDSLIGHIDRQLLFIIAGPVPSTKKTVQANIVSAAATILPALMDRFEINTPVRIAHFLPQLAHESDSFCTVEEYASGAAYEGRSDLGNVKKGDGVRFKGRALIQVTGRTNYRNLTLWLRGLGINCPDIEAEPERLEEFPWAAWGAVWFWAVKRLNTLADRDDLVGVTKVINGGTNGLEHRAACLARAKTAIAAIQGNAVSAAQNGFAVLYRGVKDREAEVTRLQYLLREAGYYHLAVDGQYGPGTEGAVKTLQARLKLTVDGIVGEKTWAAIVHLLGVPA